MNNQAGDLDGFQQNFAVQLKFEFEGQGFISF